MCDFDLEPCEVWKLTQVGKCQKLHRCDCCHGPIEKGSHYWRLFTVFEGEAGSEKECDACHAMIVDFCNDGHQRGVPGYMLELIENCIWEDFVEQPRFLERSLSTIDMVATEPEVAPVVPVDPPPHIAARNRYKLYLNQAEMRGAEWVPVNAEPGAIMVVRETRL